MVVERSRRIQLFNRRRSELTGWDEPAPGHRLQFWSLQLKTDKDERYPCKTDPFLEAWHTRRKWSRHARETSRGRPRYPTQPIRFSHVRPDGGP